MNHLQMTSPHQIPVQIAWGETCRCPIHIRIIPSAVNSGDMRLSSKLFRERRLTPLFPHHPPDTLKAIVDKNVCRIPAPMLSGSWVGYLPGMFFLGFRFSCHGDQPNHHCPKSGMTQKQFCCVYPCLAQPRTIWHIKVMTHNSEKKEQINNILCGITAESKPSGNLQNRMSSFKSFLSSYFRPTWFELIYNANITASSYRIVFFGLVADSLEKHMSSSKNTPIHLTQ